MFSKKILPFVVLSISFLACNDEESTPSLNQELKQEVVENYAAIVYESYNDSYKKAVELQTAVNTFVENPTENTLTVAKTAWLAAREPYGQTEVYRFYGGPIDAEGGPEGELNAWPLDEAFIDYVEGQPNGGIVNDETIVIDAATLRTKNEEDGVEENVSIGYHAIEFLLWGQDNTTPAEKAAGQRPATDYTTAPNADRRKEYLKVAAQLLVEDLKSLVDTWETDKKNYRADFVANVDAALANILTGMGSLSKAELAGERMKVALIMIRKMNIPALVTIHIVTL